MKKEIIERNIHCTNEYENKFSLGFNYLGGTYSSFPTEDFS